MAYSHFMTYYMHPAIDWTHNFAVRTIMFGLISLKASMTTFPFTDWIGSTTTATALNTNNEDHS